MRSRDFETRVFEIRLEVQSRSINVKPKRPGYYTYVIAHAQHTHIHKHTYATYECVSDAETLIVALSAPISMI